LPSAIRFSVIDSVFFGSSKVPDKAYCTVYLDHAWSLDAAPFDVSTASESRGAAG
jgi:lipopolysaccharide transport system ATP-binding protein